MFSQQQLIQQISNKQSFLCIGLDTDQRKIPHFLNSFENPVYEFNRRIIEATHDLCIAYKINTAFYECRGIKGWDSLIKTCACIPKHVFKIADAKRGDIGNSAEMYAQAFLDASASGMNFDAVTVTPYMGVDSVMPFLSFKGKWAILLAFTSNEGRKDFQVLETSEGKVFERVVQKALTWGNADQLMFVVGASNPTIFQTVRKYAPDYFLLVPGVGTQGGHLRDVCAYGMNTSCGLIVSSSRSIIYASSGQDFAATARSKALQLQQVMKMELENRGFRIL